MGGPWCEWSKAFLRGFPIIALSLLVTAVVRATALRVLFVRMLRAGIVRRLGWERPSKSAYKKARALRPWFDVFENLTYVGVRAYFL